MKLTANVNLTLKTRERKRYPGIFNSPKNGEKKKQLALSENVNLPFFFALGEKKQRKGGKGKRAKKAKLGVRGGLIRITRRFPAERFDYKYIGAHVDRAPVV